MIMTPATTEHHEELIAYIRASPENAHIIQECTNTFSIFSKTARAKLDKYYLLYWQPRYFFDSLQGEDNSYILRENIRYYILYCDIVTPKDILEYPQIRLSFRKPMSLSFGFVMIKRFTSMSQTFLTNHSKA